jgi:hypothetical protein
MAKAYGAEYNPETARDLRPRDFTFEAHCEVFRCTLQIPEYVLRRLDSEVMDKLHKHMESHCKTVVEDAMRGGYLHTVQGRKAMERDVGTHLKNYIWERFEITQQKAGQDRWQTAPSLQEMPVL